MESLNRYTVGIVALILLAGGASFSILNKQQESLGAPSFTDAEIIAYIENYELTKQGNGRFREHPKTANRSYEYWVNEYLAKDGMGYEVVIVRTNKDGSQDVRQVATGPEAVQRTFTWTPYNPNPLGI